MTPQSLSFLLVPKPGKSVNNLYLQTDWGIVDIISSISGVGDFESVRVNSETFEIAGKKFRLISLSDLVRAKECMGREKDLLAAKELRAIAAMRERSDWLGALGPVGPASHVDARGGGRTHITFVGRF
jgi:hypothetical protein